MQNKGCFGVQGRLRSSRLRDWYQSKVRMRLPICDQ